MKLSDKVYAALGKLYVRETFGVGVDEVTTIFAEDVLCEEDMAVFVTCLTRELASSAQRSLQARMELASLVGLTGGLFGGPLLGRHVPTLVATLLERLRGEADRQAQEALCEALATLAAELRHAKQPFGDKTPQKAPVSGKEAMETVVVPLFRTMRQLDGQAQRAGAQALKAVLGAFGDEAELRQHETHICTPLLQFFGKKDFAARLECLECLRVMTGRVGLAVDAVRNGAAAAALAALKSDDWALRRTGTLLATQLFGQGRLDNGPELRSAILELRHDKIDVVREAVAAATAAVPQLAAAVMEEKQQNVRDANRSPATRTPIRRRPMSSLFDTEGSSEEVLIVAAPSVVKNRPAPSAMPPKSGNNNNNSNNNNGGNNNNVGGDGGALLSEVRTIKKQQEELLAVIGGLTKAVESGMRTLDGRVRALEEQMQDLENALVNQSE